MAQLALAFEEHHQARERERHGGCSHPRGPATHRALIVEVSPCGRTNPGRCGSADGGCRPCGGHVERQGVPPQRARRRTRPAPTRRRTARFQVRSRLGIAATLAGPPGRLFGASAVPKYQKKETASGTVWRYQYTDPTTGERKSLTAPSVAELQHARRKLREARSMVAVGISPEVARVGPPGRSYSARLGRPVPGAVARHAGTETAAKAESYGRRNVEITISCCASLFALPAPTPHVAGAPPPASRGGMRGNGRSWQHRAHRLCIRWAPPCVLGACALRHPAPGCVVPRRTYRRPRRSAWQGPPGSRRRRSLLPPATRTSHG